MLPITLFCAFILFPKVAAASSTATVASPRQHQSRLLKEFDFFQKVCQSEGAKFFQCFAALEDPDACINCHLSFVGKDTNLLGISCQDKCGTQSSAEGTDESGFPTDSSRCNNLGINAINCFNGKVWEYHCRDEFNTLLNCDEGDCDQESHAFKECLDAGIKVLRGQSLTECKKEENTFNACIDSELSFPGNDLESCKKCHSDVGFGFHNNTCSCTYCDLEGKYVSSCIQRNVVKCPNLVRKYIECLERQHLCLPSACYSGEDWFNSETSSENFDWNQYDHFSNTTENNVIDWDKIRDSIEEAKKIAGSFRDDEKWWSNSSPSSSVTRSLFSLLVMMVIFA